MRLIGMLDSPFVRRVAVSMNLMGLDFVSEPISVFRGYDDFAAINPLVKAPTLVLDDGTTLVDSGVILDYLETLAAPERRLTAFAQADRAAAFRLIGLGIAACEKAVQLVYERQLRPAENQLASWDDRVVAQTAAALAAIEAAVPADGWAFADRPLQPDISAAIAWRFVQGKHPGLFDLARYPRMADLSARAEALPQFLASPYDEG